MPSAPIGQHSKVRHFAFAIHSTKSAIHPAPFRRRRAKGFDHPVFLCRLAQCRRRSGIHAAASSVPTEWAPGHQKFTHRTETVDYIVILSGEIDLELDGNEAAHLKQGDILVQRSRMHQRDA
jgi:hypothetical protein